MMSDGPKSWIKLERKKQNEMLGYHHDSTKLLFFQIKENQSEASSSTESTECTVLMYRALCKVVKVCKGDTKTAVKCQFSVNNRVHLNKCVNQPEQS
uniref:Uncharacterized protein n=1 Tax=Daphnia galeata TaxID=27404 RepID=A0A8J2RX46_9CRUS|nr:unnamed protein product [Daphnia galeata]